MKPAHFYNILFAKLAQNFDSFFPIFGAGKNYRGNVMFFKEAVVRTEVTVMLVFGFFLCKYHQTEGTLNTF